VLHHVEAALDALVAAVWPRARGGDIHATATMALRPFRLHPVLGASVGHGIGLSLHEGDEFRDGSATVLHEDGVYALQVGAVDPASDCVLMSAIVRSTAKGAEVLACSPFAIAP
jgi:Xaa-Pro aminopeptidase